jgi:hypothetical protein
MSSRSKIFPQDAARASRLLTLAGVALGSLVLLGCSERSTVPTVTAFSASTTRTERSELAAPTARRLVSGLQRARGSTVGPGGALYVTEAAAGRISRVDPATGAVTTFASGLPISGLVPGGVVDVAFVGETAYALVTLVSPDVGGQSVDGIYRVDGPDHFTVIADVGAFSAAHPPRTPFGVATGVQYALETFHGGFLITDGHHNRVLQVSHDGVISELMGFDNIVPTGIAVSGNTIYLAEAGPVPHLPENGKVVTFSPESQSASTIAGGAPLLVDVEFDRGRTLFALSQGIGSGGPPATPAVPNTGSLVRVNGDGTVTVISSGLDRPTSLKFIGNTAYIVTLTGEIWTIDDVADPPFGNGQR